MPLHVPSFAMAEAPCSHLPFAIAAALLCAEQLPAPAVLAVVALALLACEHSTLEAVVAEADLCAEQLDAALVDAALAAEADV